MHPGTRSVVFAEKVVKWFTIRLRFVKRTMQGFFSGILQRNVGQDHKAFEGLF
jgi:hypothetical protein